MPKIPSRLAPEQPTDGWQFVQMLDMNSIDPAYRLTPKCARCGRQLRFVHRLDHPDWPEWVSVGACCAVRLAVGYDPREAEGLARKLAGRRYRFMNPARWRRNPAKGTLTRTLTGKLQGQRVTVCPTKYGDYAFVLARTWSSVEYPTESRALWAAFDAVLKLEAQQ